MRQVAITKSLKILQASAFYKGLEKISLWCLPYVCALCGCESDNQRDLCSSCEASLPTLVNRCAVCALPLIEEKEAIFCLDCQDCPPIYDRICGLFSYESPLPSLISALKFHHQLAYARLLGELMAERAVDDWCKNQARPQVLIPVPLYEKRLRQRGYNQALELARPIGRRLGLDIDHQSCQRIRATKAQSSLVSHQRKQNLRSAFALSRPVAYQHVAIIDDVVTTGSTVRALSEALKAQGVEYIEVWCVCRT